jgi:tetratricopeptide (TPR) repeat protein
MSPPRHSPRGVITVGAALVALGAIWFAFAADDRGSAAVGVIALVVSTVITVAAMPTETRARLLSLSWRRDVDTLRVTLVEHATAQWSELTQTVAPPGARAAVAVRRGAGPARELHDVAADEAVRALFDHAAHRMALIGDAGSGKTTAATALFGELLARTRDDPRNRVPFYVRLSGWRAALSLDDWLVDQLRESVGLSRADARAARTLIVPLLDGLDEVAEIDRKACGQAIAGYLNTLPGAQILVCCRSPEYRESRLGAVSSLSTYTLEPLSVSAVRSFLADGDRTRWAPVVDALAAPGGEALAAALSSPLMLSVARDSWRNGEPAELVAATVGQGLDEAAVRRTLWDHWFRQAVLGIAEADVAKAVGLARAVQGSGAAEVRLDRLGLRATRWVWFGAKAVAACALALAVPAGLAAVVFAFVHGIVRELRDRVSRRVWEAAGTGAVLVLVVAGLAGHLVVDPVPVLACAAGAAAVCARSRLALPLPGYVRRIAHDAAQTLPVLGLGVVGAVLVTLAVVIGGGQLLGVPALATSVVAVALGLVAADLAGLDHLGQHVVARLWHRFVRGVTLTALLRRLAAAALLRHTGDGYRFFHRELLSYLATHESPVTISFDNVGVEALWDGAHSARERGDHELATALWQHVTRDRPRDALAWFNLADSLLAQRAPERRAEAFAAADRACTLAPRDPDMWYMRSEALQALNKIDDALVAADRAIGLDAAWPGYRMARATILLRLGRPGAALSDAEHACALDPTAVEPLLSRADALGALGRWPEALECVDRAVALEPGSAAPHRARSWVLAGTDRLEEALAAIDRAGELSPGDAEVWAYRAYLLRLLSRHADARVCADRAVQLDGRSVNAHVTRAMVLTELYRMSEALAAVDRATALAPDDAWVHTTRAVVLGTWARWDDALVAVDHAAVLDPRDTDAYAGRAFVLLRLNRRQEALEAADRAYDCDPQGADPWLQRADALLALGRFDKALAAVDRAVALRPSWPNYHAVRAVVLLRLNRRAAALATADRARGINPGNATAWGVRSRVLRAAGRLGAALEAVDQALTLHPGWPDHHVARAAVLVRLGRVTEALAEITEAVEIDPRCAEAYRVRAEVLAALGRYDEALGAADAAVARHPEWADHHATRARVLLLRDDPDGALTSAEHACRLDIDNVDAWNARTAALAVAGRFTEAEAASDRVLRLIDDDGPSYAARADLFRRMGRLTTARELAERACVLVPDGADERAVGEEVMRGLGV